MNDDEIIGTEWPETLKHRIIYSEMPTSSRFVKSIVKAMLNGIVLEFIYRTKDGVEHYVESAPTYLKEFKGRWYLLGNDREDNVHIYDLRRIKSLAEHWITFSLPKDFNGEKFMDYYFNNDSVPLIAL